MFRTTPSEQPWGQSSLPLKPSSFSHFYKSLHPPRPSLVLVPFSSRSIWCSSSTRVPTISPKFLRCGFLFPFDPLRRFPFYVFDRVLSSPLGLTAGLSCRGLVTLSCTFFSRSFFSPPPNVFSEEGRSPPVFFPSGSIPVRNGTPPFFPLPPPPGRAQWIPFFFAPP